LLVSACAQERCAAFGFDRERKYKVVEELEREYAGVRDKVRDLQEYL
jgi:hypothetical protein